MTGVKSKQSAIVLYDYYVLFVCCTAVSKDKRCFFEGYIMIILTICFVGTLSLNVCVWGI